MKVFRISTVPESLNSLLKGQLSFLNCHFDVTAVSGAGPNLEELAEREGVAVYPIEMERRISPLQDLKALYQLYRLFVKEKPDLVHSITPKAGLLSMLAARLAGVPIRIHTFTGLVFPSRNGAMQRLLIQMDRILCWAATHIFPEGQGVRADLINYSITDKPLKILANGNVNGVDLQYFNKNHFSNEQLVLLRQEWGISEADFVFIFVGRLVGDKGINELINAYRKILDEIEGSTSTKLLLVGPFEPELDPLSKETVAELNSNPNIILAGFQKDVRPFFAISDVLVFPSYREGFPNVVLQAGAMELPSIVTDINGSNEIIIHGKNGIIVPPKDVALLKNAMVRTLCDSEFRERLKTYSRSLILSRYTQKLVWNALLEEYTSICSSYKNADTNNRK